MGLQMGLFKINTKINSQEQLEEIVSKVEEFNYAKRQFEKLKSINDIINHHNKDILSAITELKENKLMKLSPHTCDFSHELGLSSRRLHEH